ncbi:hypothetical protein H2202_007799 [Exophiala xenobiotica]|nr:hypothetical protein H2202_007799 [Exophiala xenobiotica]KAK5192343.1 hypothetical protein LTR92_007518 [Exophiala xenobiotica]KAK5207643.1 hypothetical protein LTR41_006687 [Exophiala xenobiotica]KAK5220668.1 hypothetical protein LTR72_007290 [Exophiala xenobiotica]KAK5232372.1 hypothetical protein LTR47_006585 [Exophiala xenobiotica]
MSSRLLAVLAIAGAAVSSGTNPSPSRNRIRHIDTKARGEEFFQLGEITYLTDILHPVSIQDVPRLEDVKDVTFPLTHIIAEVPLVTGSFLEDVLGRYIQADDVFNPDFLEAILITSSNASSVLDKSAIAYLETLAPSHVFLSREFHELASTISPSLPVTILSSADLQSSPPGPYAAVLHDQTLSLSSALMLYTDEFRAFVDGVYPVNDGSGAYRSLGFFSPEWPTPSIPVPSRIYSWTDDRPLAGQRFGIKDIFDVKGLVTTSGSIAWTMITDPANATAPAIQKILDLGGVIVGKPKTSQFASAGEPWVWDDVHPPLNPRGDGWLSCSASSAGSACAVAAYDWLDYAIGSDTGTSMRRPAAVAGVYGQRPSVGRMSLEGVTPISYSTDTAGVFCRDPHKWVNFSRLWYTPELYQDRSLTGLPAYDTGDNVGLPKRILYPVDYLPLENPAAEKVLQDFLAKVTTALDMTVETFNWTERIESLSQPAGFTLPRLLSNLMVMWGYEQIQLVGKPLISKFEARYGGYPPLEQPMRESFVSTAYTAVMHKTARDIRRLAAEANEQEILFSIPDSCSESVILSDIGAGGLPAYREEDMNHGPNASFLAPPGTAGTSGDFCPFFGCVDMTVPIGEAPYWSKITKKEEMIPVTIGLVAKRGCDEMLYSFIERLANFGILTTVKAGDRAF